MNRSKLCATFIAVSTIIAAVPLVNPSPLKDGEIRVVIRGLRNDEGRVGCALFDNAEGFPRQREKAYRVLWTPIHSGSAICEFNEIPAGTYAVATLHDENSDGKMDFNWIGMPTKGYRFSNDAKATFLPPSFQAASFRYAGNEILSIIITIVYRRLFP